MVHAVGFHLLLSSCPVSHHAMGGEVEVRRTRTSCGGSPWPSPNMVATPVLDTPQTGRNSKATRKWWEAQKVHQILQTPAQVVEVVRSKPICWLLTASDQRNPVTSSHLISNFLACFGILHLLLLTWATSKHVDSDFVSPCGPTCPSSA